MTVDPEHQVERLTGPPRATRGHPELAGRPGGRSGAGHRLVAPHGSRHLLATGQAPLIHLHVNVPEGDAHDLGVEACHEGRIRRGA